MLIAYDRDEAGNRAAEKLAQQLNAAGLDAYRILFPKGMDANEYALKVGPPAKSLGVAIRAAQWLGKGKPKPLATASAEIPSISIAVVHEPSPAATPVMSAPPSPEPQPVLSSVAESAAPQITAAGIALPAQVIPDAPAPLALPETKTLGADREYVLTFGPRRYRVRGLEKNLSYESLKVNLLAAAPMVEIDRPGGPDESRPQAVHVDTLDLYQARARAAFVKSAAAELEVAEEIIKGDVGKVLLALEAEQEKLITAALEPKAAATVTIESRHVLGR